jgi:hypothetical protein
MPNHYIGDGLHTIGISGLSRVRTEPLPWAIVTALAPHPVQMHPQLPRHLFAESLMHGNSEAIVALFGIVLFDEYLFERCNGVLSRSSSHQH